MKITKALLLLLPFLAGCASQKPAVPAIDARFSNVYFEGYDDSTLVERLPDWPSDTAAQRILLSEIDGMGGMVRKEMDKRALRCSYTIVDNRELANITVRLSFLPCHMQRDSLFMPFKLRVRDLRTNMALSWSFAGRCAVPKEKSGAGKDLFHFYGVMLKEIRRTFPAERTVSVLCPGG